jgi:hypothetical protein
MLDDPDALHRIFMATRAWPRREVRPREVDMAVAKPIV